MEQSYLTVTLATFFVQVIFRRKLLQPENNTRTSFGTATHLNKKLGRFNIEIKILNTREPWSSGQGGWIMIERSRVRFPRE